MSSIKDYTIWVTILCLQWFLLCDCIVGQTISKNIYNRKNENGELFGYFIIGVNKLGINTINDHLKKNDYATFSPYFFSMGGGGHVGTPSLLIGGEGYSFFAHSEDQNIAGLYKTTLDAGYGFFNIGRVAYLNERLKVCPFLGLGGGRISLKIVENESPSSFQEVLNQPERCTEFSLGGFLIDLSLRMEFLFRIFNTSINEDKTANVGYYPIGIRIGYIFSPFDDNWEVNGIEIPVGPVIGMLGPYVRISFGFGMMNLSQN